MNQEQTNITTGKQIRHLRTQLGMTQEELAGELNVTRQALSNWERDVNEPDLNMLKKICFLFGVNMDDFAKEVITKMETYEKKEKRQFNKYDMAIGLFYGVGIFLGIGIFFVGGFMTMSGAGQWERVKKIAGTAEVFIIGIMLFGTVACQFFPEQLISIYSEDTAIVQYGVTALTIISLGFVISSLSVVTSGVCEALGKGLLSLIISLIRYIVVIIPASVIFSKMWDANGVYVAFVFTEFTAALISALLMKKVLKKG